MVLKPIGQTQVFPGNKHPFDLSSRGTHKLGLFPYLIIISSFPRRPLKEYL